jgi:hypothetical protein
MISGNAVAVCSADSGIAGLFVFGSISPKIP